MILVMLGTQDKSFKRLLEAIDKQISKGNIKEEVIVQAGYTKYESNKMKIFDLVSKDEMQELVDKARFIISHGGVGSIVEDCLKKDKKVVVAPRLKEYDEHTNDHQLQIVDRFSEMGLIIPLKDMDKLDDALKAVETFVPKKFPSNTENMIRLIEEFIDNK